MALSELALTLSQCNAFNLGFTASSLLSTLPPPSPTSEFRNATALEGPTSTGGPARDSQNPGGGNGGGVGGGFPSTVPTTLK